MNEVPIVKIAELTLADAFTNPDIVVLPPLIVLVTASVS